MYLGTTNLITPNHVTYGNTYVEDYFQAGNLGLNEDLICIPSLIYGVFISSSSYPDTFSSQPTADFQEL